MVQDEGLLFIVVTSVLLHCYFTNGMCILPVQWDSDWYDSWSGNISITRSRGQVIGWQIEAYSVTLDSWTCHIEDTENNYFVFKADTQMNVSGSLHNAYLCLKWTNITEYSYAYYLHSDLEPNAGNIRVLVLNASAAQPTNVLDFCNPTFDPTIEEFHILVKRGKEAEVKQICAPPLLGTFQYTYYDGTQTSCGSGSMLDVCTTGNTMAFNYTQCNTTQAYSAEGEVYCVYNVSDGITHYISVLNPGIVDNSKYYRFTCYAAKENNIPPSIQEMETTRIIATQNPGICELGQSPSFLPSNGARISLTSYTTCPNVTIPTTSTSTSSKAVTQTTTTITASIPTSSTRHSSLSISATTAYGGRTTGNAQSNTGGEENNTWLIIGLLLGLILLIILIVASIMMYKMMKKKEDDDDEVFYCKDAISLDPDADI